ncbi:MAG: hypothetical protein QME81_01680 [bacterium]|nr:hypothetical protein [bacterium]
MTIKIWDVEKKELLATLLASGDGWVIFTPEGYFDGEGEGLRLLRFNAGLVSYSTDELKPLLHRRPLQPLSR